MRLFDIYNVVKIKSYLGPRGVARLFKMLYRNEDYLGMYFSPFHFHNNCLVIEEKSAVVYKQHSYSSIKRDIPRRLKHGPKWTILWKCNATDLRSIHGSCHSRGQPLNP
jgi:hypothetical protein